jgi:hypothetical protein
LQFTVTGGDPNDVPANAVVLSATGLPVGATFAPATGVFAWTPSEAQQGQYVVTFTATDDGTAALADSEAVTITVREVNDAPVLDPIGNKSVDEETLVQFTVTAGDPNDVPANAVVLSATGLPVGATFAPATGVFAWTPSEAQQGQYIVTFTATDDGTPNLADSRAVTITVLGPAWQNARHACDVDGDGIIAPIDVLTLINNINSRGTRGLRAAFPPTPTPPPYLDPTGDGWISPVDVLTVINYINAHGAGPIAKAASGEGGPVAPLEPATAVTLSASGLPAGATFTPATGVFAWTPSEMQGPGSYRVTFTATDDGTPSRSDSKTIVYTVSATATDEDGTHPAANTHEVRVISANAELLAGVLYIVGTPGADRVAVNAKMSQGVSMVEVKARFLAGGKREFPGGAVTALQVALGQGNDSLTIDSQVLQPALVFGGGGHDRIATGGGRATVFGGVGHDVLTGGPGDDRLWGEAGDDMLWGGSGADELRGGLGKDVLHSDRYDTVVEERGGASELPALARTSVRQADEFRLAADELFREFDGWAGEHSALPPW